MSTVKLSDLVAALAPDITSATDIIVINDGSTTKKITVDNFFGTATNITASGIISSSKMDSEYSLFAHSASFNYISASTGDFDANTIRIGGSSWSKSDVDNLKLGKSLRSDAKQIVNENDDSTYVRMGQSGKAWHYASNRPLIKLQTSSFDLGDTTIPMTLGASSFSITGSTEISGSTTVSGSFTVTDLLTVLADYGQTGSFGVSGSASFDGDVNMDGNVNVQDLLTVLAGFNASGSSEISGSLEISGSTVGGSPPVLIITGSTEHEGSTNTNPPPVVISQDPNTNTLFYGYSFNGGNPGNMEVQATNYNTPTISYLRFSTASQAGYNDISSSPSQLAFFTAVSASASVGQPANITFTPTAAYPNHSYKFAVTSTTPSASAGYYQMNVNFIESSSLESGSAPSIIDYSGGGANGRFKFVIPPLSSSGGYTVGDLLDVLANYGATGVPIGSLGDINLDGQVNVSDLLLVLAGMGNPNNLCNDVIIPPNTNHQLIGPTISVCDGNVLTISTGSFCSITF